jgi:hypothetical protein
MKNQKWWMWTLLLGMAAVISSGAEAQVVAPAGSYSDPEWQELATKHMSKLTGLQSALLGKLGSRPFRLLTMSESAVGGIGFWAAPFADTSSRYLGVFAKVQINSASPFPDTDSGRVLQAMDRFGKDTIYALARQLESMPEPQISGGALLFIYGKGDLNSYAFEQDAEAMALFMPRQAVMSFASLQMTIQSLFSSSSMLPVFKGPQEIESLKNVILNL